MTDPEPGQVSDRPSTTNWFERHPKKTIGFLVTAVLFLGLAVTEKLLDRGLYSPGHQRFINLREHRPWFDDAVLPTDQDLRIAEILERRRYRLRVDGDGYIQPSRVHSEPDLTIVFLGGSTTECLYMEEEERFPSQVGRRLADGLKIKVNAINSGKAGNNSLHSLNILLNKVIPEQPDIVVMMHNINDLVMLLWEQSYWSPNTRRAPLVALKPSVRGSLDELSALARDALVPHLARATADLSRRFGVPDDPREFSPARGQKADLDPTRLLQQFGANLQLFIEVCRQHRLVPVLMTQASRFKDDPEPFIAGLLRRQEIERGLPYPAFKELFDLFNQEIRRTGEVKGVAVIDLAAAIPPETTFIYDPVHLTSEGSRLASQVIAQQIRSNVQKVLDPKSPPAPK